MSRYGVAALFIANCVLMSAQTDAQRDGVRLAGSSVAGEGRLEVHHNGVWGTVCDDEFSNRSAVVACSMLGYGRVGRVIANKYGAGSGQIWLDNVVCNGTEQNLDACRHNGWGTNDCQHSEDVSITCNKSPADCSVDVRAYSAGVNSPVNGYVTLNSHQIWAASWCCPQFYPNRRGVNIIVVDPFSCTHSDVRNFDTFRSVDESADLVAYLQYVRDGTIIIGVTGDEATKQLAPVIRTLRVAGIDVGDVQYRGNFVFVIQKGYIEKTLMSKALTNKVPPATISVRLQGLSTEDITIVRA